MCCGHKAKKGNGLGGWAKKHVIFQDIATVSLVTQKDVKRTAVVQHQYAVAVSVVMDYWGR